LPSICFAWSLRIVVILWLLCSCWCSCKQKLGSTGSHFFHSVLLLHTLYILHCCSRIDQTYAHRDRFRLPVLLLSATDSVSNSPCMARSQPHSTRPSFWVSQRNVSFNSNRGGFPPRTSVAAFLFSLAPSLPSPPHLTLLSHYSIAAPANPILISNQKTRELVRWRS
jgi:hypothetical protein